MLDCRSKSSVGEKKGHDDCCNVNDKAIATERVGVTLFDLISNAEISGMMDDLREELEMERAKCKGLPCVIMGHSEIKEKFHFYARRLLCPVYLTQSHNL